MPAPSLSWLHLSDLHIGLKDPGLDRRRLFEQMFDDLRALLDRTGLGPDLIVFTGDLTQLGTAAQFDEFDEVFWAPLHELVGAHTQVLAIPGNHDLQRPRNDDETPAWAKQILNDPSQLWRSTEFQSRVSGCFTAYADWWSRQTQPANLRSGLFPGDFLVTIEVEGVRWGIAGLNTAVTQLASDTGSLWVNKAQLVPALERGRDLSTWIDNHAATILLTHHPEEWLHEDASKDFRTGLCANDFDLHLFGHMHESFDDERRINAERERIRIQAPSLFGLRTRFTKQGRPDVERRFGYVLTEAKLEAESLVRTTWPRAAYLQPTGRWVFGSDRSYTYEHDVLAIQARSPRNNRLLVPIKAVERRPRRTGVSWPQAVFEHRLWASACGVEVSRWRQRAREDVTTIAAQLQGLERPGDPWRDADYVPRVLAWLDTASRALELSGPQVHALLVAPCLRELVELNSLAELERHEIDDWSPGQPTRSWRRVYESVLARHPRLVRRATGLEPTRRRCMSLWFARQAIDLVSFRVPIPKLERLEEYVYEFARAVGRGSEFLRAEGGPAEAPDLVAPDGRPLTRPMLAALLSWAGAMALDLRHVDSSLLEHVVADGYSLDKLLEALADGHWSGQRPVDVFEYVCDDAITHYALTQLIETSARRAADIYMLEMFEPVRSHLPAQLSARGVEPRLDGGRPRFQPHHVRFRLDNSRVREMLMGESLYGSAELALRELYQNALDACRYRRARVTYLDRQQPYADHRYQPKIYFVQGRTKQGRSFIECVDNGVGMDLPTLEHVFAVAGRRFHDRGAFVDERNAWLKQGIDFVPNSQHGIGVLSYFMLADEIEIETRAFRRDGRFGEGLRIRITSATGVFRIDTLTDDGKIDAGTRVRLYLHDGLDDALGARPRTSILEALAKLLIVAEFQTSAIEYLGDPDEGGLAANLTIWEPGKPLARAEVWPTGHPNIWWSDSEVPVLSDGLVTGHKHPCLLINLCGDQ